jgi:hypothetical protein
VCFPSSGPKIAPRFGPFPYGRYEVTQAEYVEKLPKGKLSTKGLGVHAPDMAGAVTLDDGTVRASRSD